ncbi:MAG: Dabb family protein [Actinomycetota bacterium]
MSRIQHTVTFRLKESVDVVRFLDQCLGLAVIAGVEDFEVLHQVGTKNGFSHGLSMWFADAEAYAAYDAHPTHQAFVNDVWLPQVEDFLELDYVRTPPGG